MQSVPFTEDQFQEREREREREREKERERERERRRCIKSKDLPSVLLLGLLGNSCWLSPGVSSVSVSVRMRMVYAWVIFALLCLSESVFVCWGWMLRVCLCVG